MNQFSEISWNIFTEKLVESVVEFQQNMIDCFEHEKEHCAGLIVRKHKKKSSTKLKS